MMRLRLEFFVRAAALITLSLSSGVSHQDRPESPQASDLQVVDHFVGTWKLNVDKSSQPAHESELIKIEPRDGDYKFTYDEVFGNGTNLHWWFVTAMKGGAVKPTQTNGRPMSGESRITRHDSNSFVVESAVFKDEYNVSSDGTTLTDHRTLLMDPAPHKLPKKTLLVFDRVAQTGP
jgi:hypothetical protein